MKHFFTQVIFLFCCIFSVEAQLVFEQNDSVAVKINGSFIKNPWSGGINYAQFSAIDLNLDGTKDLVVFDRTGNKILPFINNGTPNTIDYTYAPAYRSRFPQLHDWALFIDFNGDGKEDIFTYSLGGFSVFKNVSFPGIGLNFVLETYIVKSHYSSSPTDFTGLYVSRVDIPAIADIDYDGDLDVLTFDINSGTEIEYHRNMSMDVYGIPDSLNDFKKEGACWGNFTANTTNTVNLNVACRPAPAGGGGVLDTSQFNKALHVGSTDLALDIDDDHDYDMLMGGVSSNDLNLLTNGGDSLSASISAQENFFPQNDLPIDITIFPAAFHLDVDNDGNKDLIAAPNAGNSSENFNSAWFYKDIDTTGASRFSFQNNSFLQNQMIEVGEGCYPTFFDYNSDGLKDLVIGNYGYFNAGGTYSCKLALFKNVGTLIQPEFELITRDYVSLGAFNLSNIYPGFGDMDGDGDQDMVIGTNNNAGSILYFENIAGLGNTANFVLSNPSLISAIGQYPAPQLVDVDRDGKLDLLIGIRNGTISYHRNVSAAGLVAFSAITSNFGNLSVAPNGGFVGYCSPQLIDEGGIYHLYAGNVDGHIYHYDGIDGNLAGSFTLQDSIYRNINEGDRISIAFADLNNDNYPELLVGNYSGGVTYFKGKQKLTSTNSPEGKEAIQLHLYPNPATNFLQIKLVNEAINSMKYIRVYSSLGALVQEFSATGNSFLLNTETWNSGVYSCKISVGNSFVWKKFSVTK